MTVQYMSNKINVCYRTYIEELYAPGIRNSATKICNLSRRRNTELDILYNIQCFARGVAEIIYTLPKSLLVMTAKTHLLEQNMREEKVKIESLAKTLITGRVRGSTLKPGKWWLIETE